MESTGLYWIPLYELLDSRGLDVKLVDARRVKNLPGRKSDVLDCQWLQELHTYGLLEGAFRPESEIVVLRSFLRQRAMLVRSAASHIQQMQKALSQMNLQLHNVISEIGCDMRRCRTGKDFGSWICLSPGSKISGGKVLSTRSKPGANRAANALRQAAQSLDHRRSA